MIDVFNVLFEWLTTSGTTLYSATATRVYDGALPKNFRNDAQTLVVSYSDTRRFNVEDHELIVTVKGYAASDNPDTVEALGRLVHDRLHDAHGATASGRIVLSEYLAGQRMPPDPDTGWLCHMSRYVVHITAG